MIPVAVADEPDDFDRRVRQRGLAAIDAMVGRPPRRAQRGPKRARVADREQDIPPARFPPYWRDALDDMLERYHRVCAYLGLYIEHGTGSPSVDHVVPKSLAWDQVYEWRNYRLCAALINARKGVLPLALDPFEIGHHWFALEVVGFQVLAGAGIDAALAERIRETIVCLGLNAPDCCKARREYVVSYEDGHIDLAYLERRAPFVAVELRRQALLHRGDV